VCFFRVSFVPAVGYSGSTHRDLLPRLTVRSLKDVFTRNMVTVVFYSCINPSTAPTIAQHFNSSHSPYVELPTSLSCGFPQSFGTHAKLHTTLASYQG